MKTMKLWMMAAILFCGLGCSDGNKTNEERTGSTEAVQESNALPGVERYLVDSIGPRYAQGDVCIPCVIVVTNEIWHGDSAKVKGDFWVFNYNIVGDTLKCVSGGSHPGMMILHFGNDGKYVVTSFDQVVDGAGNVESAKRIFGDVYDAFAAFSSDEKKREDTRASYIADYVKAHNLPVKYYQDYGWPAKEIPAE